MTIYNGEHSLIFRHPDDSNEVNTWDSWHLIPTSRPSMSIPGTQNKFVEIPGMSGSYDLSDYLTSETVYADRSGSFEFVVDNEYEDWVTLYKRILSYLQGRRLRMILTDDPKWFYEGRFNVDGWVSEPARSKVTISYRVGPFKTALFDLAEDVIWDTFNFTRDEDWSVVKQVTVNNSTQTFDFVPSAGYGSDKFTVRMISGSSVTITCGSTSATLNGIGKSAVLSAPKNASTAKLTFTGTGTVTVSVSRQDL